MWEILHGFRPRDAIDILIVSYVFYRVFLMFRGTLAVQMLMGLAFLMGASFASKKLELHSINWILENFWAFWVLALVVLFQPELRRTLAQVGRGHLFQRLVGTATEEQAQILDEVIKAVESLSSRRIGALVVLERETGLRHYAELGVPVDARVSADLLTSIFLPYSPLHDGAVFIQEGRVSAAACFLPLSRNVQLSRSLGTRHRAALGISEETDAVVVVASEETGRISLAVEGRLESAPDGPALRERLASLFVPGEKVVRTSLWEMIAKRLPIREKV